MSGPEELRALLVVDGERDPGMVHALASKVEGARIAPQPTDPDGVRDVRRWRELRTHRGYQAKLHRALDEARRSGFSCVLAVVDADKDPGRLGELKAARAEAHASAPVAAVGEARPTGEAWLLADRAAVSTVLELPIDRIPKRIPASSASAKQAFEELVGASTRHERPRDLAREIALAIDPRRVPPSDETGLLAFVADVERHLPRSAG